MKSPLNFVFAILTVSSSLLSASVIEYTPHAPSNPLELSGVTDGVAWDVNVAGNHFSQDPTVTDTAVNEFSFVTQSSLLVSDDPNVIGVEVNFSQPVFDVSFTIRSFGVLVKNYTTSLIDFSGGTQTFTLTGYNGADAVAGSAISGTSGALIDLETGDHSLTGNALVEDTAGGVIAQTVESSNARLANLAFTQAITRFVLTFTADAQTTRLSADTIRVLNINFNTVPEPSSTMVIGSMFGLIALRRRR